MTGHLILIVAPSGSGKGSLLTHLRRHFSDVRFAVSCTTRSIRPNEIDGVNYCFLSEEEFKRRAEEGDFVEWASYGGNLYGTPKSEVIDPIERGEIVIREVEIQGARAIRNIIPGEQLSIIFVDGGPWEALVERIKARAPITDEELEQRQTRFEEERVFMTEADFIIKNYEGELESAKEQITEVIENIIKNTLHNSAQ